MFSKAEFHSDILATIRGTIPFWYLGNYKRDNSWSRADFHCCPHPMPLFCHLIQVFIGGFYCLLCQNFLHIFFMSSKPSTLICSAICITYFTLFFYTFSNTFRNFPHSPAKHFSKLLIVACCANVISNILYSDWLSIVPHGGFLVGLDSLKSIAIHKTPCYRAPWKFLLCRLRVWMRDVVFGGMKRTSIFPRK